MNRILFALALFVIGCSSAVAQDGVVNPQTDAGKLTTGTLPNARLSVVPNSVLNTMTNSTVKCRTTAGAGVPEDCTAAQAAAIIGGVGGAVKAKVINTTYTLTTASGTQDITGFGFDPTSVEINYAINGGSLGGVGFASSDGSQGASATTTDNGAFWVRTSTQAVIVTNQAVSNVQTGVVSFITDGIRVTWTKAGSPTGTLGITVAGKR